MTKFTRNYKTLKILRAGQESVSGNGREGSRKTLSFPGQPFLFLGHAMPKDPAFLFYF